MTTPFPALCPSSRSFVPAQYPVRRFTAINGAGTSRIYGSRGFDATLSLSFLLQDNQLAELLECWNDAFGTFDELTLPFNVMQGMSNEVQGEIPEYLTWRWASAPQVESVLNGVSRVQVNLIGNLD